MNGDKVTKTQYDKLKNTFTCADIKFKPILKTEVEPVYHMVSGLSKATLIKSIDVALNNLEINEIVPINISSKYDLMNTYDAIKEIHHPSDSKRLKDANIKLKYEELFEFMFKINLIKFKNQVFDDFVIKDIDDNTIKKVLSYVPFDLTEDQMKAFNDIIDDFKGINDRYGHQYGDEVLKKVAKDITELFGGNGIQGRFGGDEFVILTIDMSQEELENRLMTLKETTRLCAGVTKWRSGESIKDTFDRADRGMYQVKLSEKNGILFCD